MSKIASGTHVSEQKQSEINELLKNYQPTSGISYLDRPNGLTAEEQGIIQARLKLKALSSS